MQLPVETEGIKQLELAKRVKFESNNVIRIVTQDNRDILFELSLDDKTKYLSDVEIEILPAIKDSMLTDKTSQETLAE